MLRRSRTLRWYCACCSMDPPSSLRGGGQSIRRARRLVKHIAKRREERVWRREAGEDS